MDRHRTRSQRAAGTVLTVAMGLLVVAGCTSSAPSQAAWSTGPTLGSDRAASPSVAPTPAGSRAVNASARPIAAEASPGATPKPFSGRMTPQVLLHDGFVSFYMDLANTGSEPLTFINTLYDTEPTKLYNPTVAFPWTTGAVAAVTRAGRFFPSPAIVQPGHRAAYMMGGIQATGTGELDAPVANIKFCPTRGMDDVPSVPLEVKDLAWSTTDGVTRVHGTLVDTEGTQRPDPPVVGVAFFDEAGAFVGAVVDGRNGDRMPANASRPFEMEGRGVVADRIFRAEAFAFAS